MLKLCLSRVNALFDGVYATLAWDRRLLVVRPGPDVFNSNRHHILNTNIVTRGGFSILSSTARNISPTMDLMSRTLQASSSRSKPSHVSYSRRRMQPEQLQALQSLYDLKSHPTKEERSTLARELNLYELAYACALVTNSDLSSIEASSRLLMSGIKINDAVSRRKLQLGDRPRTLPADDVKNPRLTPCCVGTHHSRSTRSPRRENAGTRVRHCDLADMQRMPQTLLMTPSMKRWTYPKTSTNSYPLRRSSLPRRHPQNACSWPVFHQSRR